MFRKFAKDAKRNHIAFCLRKRMNFNAFKVLSSRNNHIYVKIKKFHFLFQYLKKKFTQIQVSFFSALYLTVHALAWLKAYVGMAFLFGHKNCNLRSNPLGFHFRSYVLWRLRNSYFLRSAVNIRVDCAPKH